MRARPRSRRPRARSTPASSPGTPRRTRRSAASTCKPSGNAGFDKTISTFYDILPTGSASVPHRPARTIQTDLPNAIRPSCSARSRPTHRPRRGQRAYEVRRQEARPVPAVRAQGGRAHRFGLCGCPAGVRLRGARLTREGAAPRAAAAKPGRRTRSSCSASGGVRLCRRPSSRRSSAPDGPAGQPLRPWVATPSMK